MIAAPIIVAYYISWGIYARSFFVADIPGDKITHINYAFANIDWNGGLALGDSWADVEKAFPGDTWDQPVRGNFNQLLKLKQKYPQLRTLISVGGWTWSGKFSDVALTPSSRARFAQSCVDFVQKYGFDGVDLDWEYPVSGGLPTNIVRPEDKQNYVLLLQAIRQAFDTSGTVNGKKYLLTVATGASPSAIANMDLLGMSNYLDWINIITYDYHGGWENKTGHNAPLFKNNDEIATDIAPEFIKSKYNCNATVNGYIAAGVPRSKLVMGMPLYGRGWQGVTSTIMNGFSQPASIQLPTGTWENGIFDYDHLMRSYVPSYTRYWDNQSQVPFLYNPGSTVWITYDDLQSVGLKTDYIKREGLGGAMFWELSGDRGSQLVGATFLALNGGVFTSPSWISSTVQVTATADTTRNQTRSTAPTTTTPIASSSVTGYTSASSTSSQQSGSSTLDWQPLTAYRVNDLVTYEKRTYRCIQAHTSLADWIPPAVPAIWQLI